MIRVLLIGVALLATSARFDAQPRARVNLPGFRETVVLDTVAVSAEIDAPVGRLYSATVAAFEGMKIPMEVSDSAGGLVGNLRLTIMRRLAGEPLSKYLGCGSSITGPNADSYRVSAALVAILEPRPNNTSRLRVGLAAGARDMIGTSNDAVQCGTTGVFEARLIERIKTLISTSSGGS